MLVWTASSSCFTRDSTAVEKTELRVKSKQTSKTCVVFFDLQKPRMSNYLSNTDKYKTVLFYIKERASI